MILNDVKQLFLRHNLSDIQKLDVFRENFYTVVLFLENTML